MALPRLTAPAAQRLLAARHPTQSAPDGMQRRCDGQGLPNNAGSMPF